MVRRKIPPGWALDLPEDWYPQDRGWLAQLWCRFVLHHPDVGVMVSIGETQPAHYCMRCGARRI